jgi:hypothetical protein
MATDLAAGEPELAQIAERRAELEQERTAAARERTALGVRHVGRREPDLQREDQFKRRVDRALLIKR